MTDRQTDRVGETELVYDHERERERELVYDHDRQTELERQSWCMTMRERVGV